MTPLGAECQQMLDFHNRPPFWKNFLPQRAVSRFGCRFPASGFPLPPKIYLYAHLTQAIKSIFLVPFSLGPDEQERRNEITPTALYTCDTAAESV